MAPNARNGWTKCEPSAVPAPRSVRKWFWGQPREDARQVPESALLQRSPSSRLRTCPTTNPYMQLQTGLELRVRAHRRSGKHKIERRQRIKMKVEEFKQQPLRVH